MAKEFSTPDELKYVFHPATGPVCDFKIQAPNDAHIALTMSDPEEKDPMYEVFIGGWRNSKSVIRKNRTKPDVVEVDTPNILSEDEFRGFWIKFEDGQLSVGREGEDAPFMVHEDNDFRVGYWGFCTGWGASGNWIVKEPPKREAYWEKASNGAVPANVVTGGTDSETGDVLLVARAEHEGAIIPGKFVPSHGVTYVSWGGDEHAKEEYEILCGVEPKWVSAQDGEIPPGALEGGRSEDGEVLYIGRVNDGEKLMIGKVHTSHKVCYVPYGGSELAYPNYEVLVV